MQITKFEVGNFENNCYIVAARCGAALLVDAPWEPDVILDRIDKSGATVEYIVLTHGHGDHVQALREVRAELGVPALCHADDAHMMPVGPDDLIEDGDILEIGDLRIGVLHTPGHTPGGVCLVAGETPSHLFSGDTLFPGGPGNTKQPLGDFDLIMDSLDRRIFTLPDSTAVHPGHGADTTIGTERPELPKWRTRRW